MAVDIHSEGWLAEANAEIKRKGCPQCKAGNAEISREFVSKPIGTFSLAGMQMKTTGSFVIVLRCPDCGVTARLDQTDA